MYVCVYVYIYIYICMHVLDPAMDSTLSHGELSHTNVCNAEVNCVSSSGNQYRCEAHKRQMQPKPIPEDAARSTLAESVYTPGRLDPRCLQANNQPANKQASKQTHRHTNKQASKQASMQTHTHTHPHTHAHTRTHTHTHTHPRA